MNICLINKKPHLLSMILSLHKKNTSTLGFLPKGAFESYAANNQIILATDDAENLIGYLLFSINSKNNHLYIVHLCVESDYRRSGVARELFDFLKIKMKDKFRGVRVRCRTDYEATKVWDKLNFIHKTSIPGRSKAGSTLIVWWYDFGVPNLFTDTSSQTDNGLGLIKAVIDSSVFFSLTEEETLDPELNRSLNADWLLETTELWVTPELRTEINRNENKDSIKKSLSRLGDYPTVEFNQTKYEEVLEKLKNTWKRNPGINNDSDIKQLAMTIAADIKYFITNDESIRNNLNLFRSEFDLFVINPIEFLLIQDSILNDKLYDSTRLAGSFIEIKRLSVVEINTVIDSFFDKKYERKKEFEALLLQQLNNLDRNKILIIKNPEIIGLICLNFIVTKTLQVPVIRFKHCPIMPELQEYIIGMILSEGGNASVETIEITDRFITNELKPALNKYGFINENSRWIKRFYERFLSLEQFYKQSGLLKPLTLNSILIEEKKKWPTKIEDLEIPCYLVPIKPEWAMHLFDSNIGEHSLFGSNPSLIFKLENIYYKSAKSKLPTAPSRILWYVSNSKDKYSTKMAIRATSYCDKVIIDEPKSLFNDYGKLGVYTQKHLEDIGKGDAKILAFKFSMTELFCNPIPIKEVRKKWSLFLNNNFLPITSFSIPKELFFTFYRQGVKIEK